MWRRFAWRLAGLEERFDLLEVFLGVDAYGVVVGGLDVEADAVFKEAELF